MHSIGEVARLAGVTVRALHHYDHIGLVKPGARSEAGYRLYDDADLERLQGVLFYRSLGFELAQIGRVMDDPGFDRATALAEQRGLLLARMSHLEAMVAAVDAALIAHQEGVPMEPEEMFEVFGDFDPARYEAEAAERWPEAYAESKRRTSRYAKEEWKEALGEAEEIASGFADLLRAGAPPSGSGSLDLAERHRRSIDRWFYPCPPDVHRGLGEMYVRDARFTEWWDRFEPGLAAFVAEAFAANAQRAGRPD